MSLSIKELLLTNRNIDKITSCWNWTGRLHPDGYGVISLKLENDKRHKDYLIHRLSYIEFKGSLINFALHKCNNPKCFNPDHLYDGNHTDNAIDLLEAGNHTNKYGKTNKNFCSNGHELIKPNLVWWGGKRTCRICANARTKRHRAKKL